MLLEEIYEVQKPENFYKDNQGTIFLENNRQVGMRIKHINIPHHYMRDMVEKCVCISSILGVNKNLWVL